jgi:hypothetical protein
MSEKRFESGRPESDDDIDDVDRSDGDEAEAFAEDVGENGDVEDFEDPDYPDADHRQAVRAVGRKRPRECGPWPGATN